MSTPLSDEGAFELLHDMVATPSFSGSEAGFSERFALRLTGLGLAAGIDDAGNLSVQLPARPGAPTLALVGHIDTVSGAPPVHFDGTSLWGRGAVDAKGPFAAFIAAATRFRASPLAEELAITIIGCVEEEAPSSRGARHLIETGMPAPDFLIVGEPSGADGITLGYKGFVAARIRLEAGCVHGAHEAASIAERGAALWGEIDARARSFGSSADDRPTPMFDALLPRLRAITTENHGATESVELDIALRLPPGFTPSDALDWLDEQAHAAAGEDRCSVLPLAPGVPPFSGPRTTPLTRALARSILGTGHRPVYKQKSGTADLNLLAPHWGCPAVAYGPGDAALDHRPDERIERAEFLCGIQVLEATFQELAQATAPLSR